MLNPATGSGRLQKEPSAKRASCTPIVTLNWPLSSPSLAKALKRGRGYRGGISMTLELSASAQKLTKGRLSSSKTFVGSSSLTIDQRSCTEFTAFGLRFLMSSLLILNPPAYFPPPASDCIAPTTTGTELSLN